MARSVEELRAEYQRERVAGFRREVLEVLSDGVERNTNQLTALLPYKRATAAVWLREMFEAGLVGARGGPRGAVLYSLPSAPAGDADDGPDDQGDD